MCWRPAGTAGRDAGPAAKARICGVGHFRKVVPNGPRKFVPRDLNDYEHLRGSGTNWARGCCPTKTACFMLGQVGQHKNVRGTKEDLFNRSSFVPHVGAYLSIKEGVR